MIAIHTANHLHSYACYHAIVTIVNSYLDPVQDGVELNARKTLTTSLTQLAGVDSLS